MDFFTLVSVYFMNAFIVLYFYFQLYFWQMVLFIIMLICLIIECKEKDFHYVHDDRKVI